MMLTEQSLRTALCAAIEVEKAKNAPRFRVALPLDIGGGDLCQVLVEQTENGILISDEGFTLQKAKELGDRYRRRSFRQRLEAILEVYGIEDVQGSLHATVEDLDVLGETVFEITQAFASIIELSHEPSKVTTSLRERGELKLKVKQRLKESGLSDRELFRPRDTIRVRFHDTMLPLIFDYGYGTPKFPETVFQRVIAGSQKAVTSTLLMFEKTHRRKNLKRVSLVSAESAEPAESRDWNFEQGVALLKNYSDIIDVDNPASIQQLRDSIPRI